MKEAKKVKFKKIEKSKEAKNEKIFI